MVVVMGGGGGGAACLTPLTTPLRPRFEPQQNLHGLGLSSPRPFEVLEVAQGGVVILGDLVEHLAVPHEVQVDVVAIRAAVAAP